MSSIKNELEKSAGEDVSAKRWLAEEKPHVAIEEVQLTPKKRHSRVTTHSSQEGIACSSESSS